MAENHRIHNCLVDGYRLTYIDSDGNEANPTIRLLSQSPDQNDWLAVNQVTLVQVDYKRRFDVVLYWLVIGTSSEIALTQKCQTPFP